MQSLLRTTSDQAALLSPWTLYSCPAEYNKMLCVHVQRLAGSRDLAITSVAWTHKETTGAWRLFTAGLDGWLTEWDIQGRRPKQRTDSMGGAVWGMAVQPSSEAGDTLTAVLVLSSANRQCIFWLSWYRMSQVTLVLNVTSNIVCLFLAGPSSTVAVACDDGCLRLFRAEEGQPGLVYAASLPALGSRLLSVAWNPKGNVVLTGTSEGSLHAWNVNSRREILRIHTGMLLGLSGTCWCCRFPYTTVKVRQASCAELSATRSQPPAVLS